jgi:7-cyano-7-deazaguanine synthase
MVAEMEKTTSAVLVSGGLDSDILLAEVATAGTRVFPIYIQEGFPWESAEQHYLRRFLSALGRTNIQPLQVLALPVSDLYGHHWSMTGQGVPDASSPDEAVHLPGRNVLLLAKAMLWCHLHEVPTVALAVLSANPFPDATPAFFEAYSATVNQAIGGAVQVLRPYSVLKKIDVIHRGQGLPLELTYSCIQPEELMHCGRCNKCGERRRAFAEAGMPDPTEYAPDHEQKPHEPTAHHSLL